jgi:hypothetical protein
MLHNITDFYGSKLAASDGIVGHLKDFLFDDKTWEIRYVVVDPETSLAGRLVLISPHALGRFDREARLLVVHLTRSQIQDSPSIEAHMPITRPFEIDYYRYYGWPTYWEAGEMGALGNYSAAPPETEDIPIQSRRHAEDKSLRSAVDVSGFNIQTSNGIVGRLTGLVVDEGTWRIKVALVGKAGAASGSEIELDPELIKTLSVP